MIVGKNYQISIPVNHHPSLQQKVTGLQSFENKFLQVFKECLF